MNIHIMYISDMKRLIRALFLLAFLLMIPGKVDAFTVRPSHVDIQATSMQRSFSVFVENVQNSSFLLSVELLSKDGSLTKEQISEIFSLPEGQVSFNPGQVVDIPIKFQNVEDLSGNHELELEITATPSEESGSVGLISVFSIPVTIGFGPAIEDFSGLDGVSLERISSNKIRVIARVENATQRRLTGFYAVEVQKGDFRKVLGGENVVLRGASERELQSEYSIFSLKERLFKPVFGKALIRVSYLPTFGADYQVFSKEIYIIPWLPLGVAGLVFIFGIMFFVRLKNVKKS